MVFGKSVSFASIYFVTINDNHFFKENLGQLNTPPNHDINTVPAWLAGYSGKNVTICIIDDGLDHRHPDLVDSYVSIQSILF